jgi:hypothetical protein
VDVPEVSFRRARPVEEVERDPEFHFHVGQLIGAMQMAGYVLVLHDDPKVQEVGRRLWESSGWFFVGSDVPPRTSSETDTAIMPALKKG